jgi:hypothetical protein
LSAEDGLGPHGAKLQHRPRDEIAGILVRTIKVEAMAKFAVEIEEQLIGQLRAPTDRLRRSWNLFWTVSPPAAGPITPNFASTENMLSRRPLRSRTRP